MGSPRADRARPATPPLAMRRNAVRIRWPGAKIKRKTVRRVSWRLVQIGVAIAAGFSLNALAFAKAGKKLADPTKQNVAAVAFGAGFEQDLASFELHGKLRRQMIGQHGKLRFACAGPRPPGKELIAFREAGEELRFLLRVAQVGRIRQIFHAAFVVFL